MRAVPIALPSIVGIVLLGAPLLITLVQLDREKLRNSIVKENSTSTPGTEETKVEMARDDSSTNGGIRSSISFIYATEEQWDAMNNFYGSILGLKFVSTQVSTYL